jgi:O-antigen ligase
VFGAGFEDFWISPSVEKFQRAMIGWWHPEGLNEAHNGYIEVYLNLGWIGVGLISVIILTGYRRAVRAFRVNQQVGGLFLVYVIVAAVHNITEAGFRMLDPMWIFLLLAVMGSSGVAAGYFGAKSREELALRSRKGRTSPERNVPQQKREAIYAAENGLTPFRTARANNRR